MLIGVRGGFSSVVRCVLRMFDVLPNTLFFPDAHPHRLHGIDPCNLEASNSRINITLKCWIFFTIFLTFDVS